MSNHHSEAREAARILIDVALERLREMLGAGHVRRCAVQRLVIEAPGSMSLPTDYIYDWWTASTLVLMELEESSTYLQFEKAVKGDPVIGQRMDTMIGTSTHGRLMRCEDFVSLLLLKILEDSCDDLELSDSRFNKAWNSTVQLLLADHVRVKHWCILENVESPVGSTDVLPGVSLCGLKTNETEDLWNHSSFVQYRYPFFGAAGTPIMDIQTLLETTTNEPVVIGEGPFDSSEGTSRFASVQSSFESVCTSIRLIHSEPILLSPIFVETEDVWDSTSGYSIGERANIVPGRRCKLSGQDLQEMQALQESLKLVSRGESRFSNAISLCLRRIGFANTRISAEDKILDIVMTRSN